MKITDIITELQKAKTKYGDVQLYTENDDGRSTWVSLFQPVVTISKNHNGHAIHLLQHKGH